MQPHILLIDDDENFCKTLKKSLTLRGFSVDTLSKPEEAPPVLQRRDYRCLLLDMEMNTQKEWGLEFLRQALAANPLLPVIIVSGASTIASAVQALKLGAYDFIEKSGNIDPEKIAATIHKALERQRLMLDRLEKETLYEELPHNDLIIGKSPALQNLVNEVRKIAATEATVLIFGESGAGKELIASAIHQNSNRRSQPYITLNCAALPHELLESELFGYCKGAFTGANHDRKGKFLAANGGTLFLDEIGDLDIHLQAKLLRVLDDKKLMRLGEDFFQTVNVRIIAATHRDLKKMLPEKFREDLYHRLNVISLYVPPLRERREDILPLAYHFLKKFNKENNRQVWTLQRQAESVLVNYSWPGNVRELKNIMERLVVLSEGTEIKVEEVLKRLDEKSPFEAAGGAVPEKEPEPLREASARFERDYIIKTLNRFSWRITETARALGIDRTTLFRKMRDLEIHRP